MYEEHIKIIESSLKRGIEKQGLHAIAKNLFVVFFEKHPDTEKYFEGTVIDTFCERKFKIIYNFLIDTLKYPDYADGAVCTEVIRHQIYGLKDKEYYFALVDSVLLSVKLALEEEWTLEIEEFWSDASVGLKKIIYDSAADYL